MTTQKYYSFLKTSAVAVNFDSSLCQAAAADQAVALPSRQGAHTSPGFPAPKASNLLLI